MSKDYSKITKIGKCCGTCEYISNANAGVVKHRTKNNIIVNIFTCCDE